MLRLSSLRLSDVPDSRLAASVRLAALAFWAVALAVPAGAQDGPTLDQELDQALSLTPNLENGRALYQNCVACHGDAGWGSTDGSYPQIAGQHRNVIIKQLVDIRFRRRDNPVMQPFVERDVLGGPQALADTMHAAWIAFIRDGDPGDCAASDALAERGERWDRYDAARRPTLELGDQVRVLEDPWGEERALWDGLR